MSKDTLANLLAKCILAGEPSVEAAVERCSAMLGYPWRWLRSLVEKHIHAITDGMRPSEEALAQTIQADEDFEHIWVRHQKRLAIERLFTDPQRMHPVEAATYWPVPPIETARNLAEWFWLEDGQLEWFADLRGLGYRTRSEKLRHYRYRILQKKTGGLRLVEAPKKRLKEMQRQILDYMLGAIPAHAAVHGFVKGRSIKSFAAPHVGQAAVLRMDIKNFFPTFSCTRIQALFRTIGYREAVAELLGGICTTVTPAEVCRELGDITYSARHLPQGSPSSPALANLCAYRMDCRLSGLAHAAGAKYTRYADDLAFSGGAGFARSAERFSAHVAAILLEEGFAVHHRKTRIMPQGARQHLAGLVTNEKLNVTRREFDELKAILNNCIRSGPASQNRDQRAAFREHLNGRVGFVETVNPARGEKLRRMFERIRWPLL